MTLDPITAGFLFAISTSEWIGMITLVLSTIFVPLAVKFVRSPQDKRQFVITDAQNAQEILRGTNEALYKDRDDQKAQRTEWQKYAACLEDILEREGIHYPIEQRP